MTLGFVEIASTANKNWYGLAMSHDGSRQTAVVRDGNIWTSQDYGASWTENTSTGAGKDWYWVAISRDGQKQTAIVWGGNIWMSQDYGNTWTENTSTGAGKYWRSVAMSSDGSRQTATIFGENGNIWTFSKIEQIEKINLSLLLPNDVNKLTINAGGKTYTLYIPVIQLLDEAKLEKMSKEELQEWLSDPGKARLLTTQIVNKDGSINDSVSHEVIKKNIGLIVRLLGLGTWNGSYKTEEKKDEFKNRGITYDHLLDQSIIVNM